MLVATMALALCAGYGFAGKKDLSRPHVILPAVWFLAVAVAQLKLLDFETAWSTETTAVVFGAPLLFSLTCWLASTGCPDRPNTLPETKPDTGRLRVAAIALLLGGCAGLAWKSTLLGGIPLLSDSIDELRSAGGIRIPAYVTFLTDGFFLSSWVAAVSLIGGKGRGRLLEWCLLIAGFAGVALSASRNTMLLTIAIPLISMYRAGLLRAFSARQFWLRAAVALAVASIVSGLFFYRTSQHSHTAFEEQFYGKTVRETPVLLRPMLPVYIGLAVPFETLNRLIETPPPEGGAGAYSLPGVPPQIWPLGSRYKLYLVTGLLTQPYYFNVATFVGGFYADGRLLGAFVGSILLGLAFGFMWRIFASKNSLAYAVLSAYVVYLTAFLLYEDLLGFYTLSVVWDMLVLGYVLSWSTRGARRGADVEDDGGRWMAGRSLPPMGAI
jgi:oligosaccharide repeat unit polymerase